MNYRYNFDDRKKSKRNKLLFLLIVVIVVIIVSAFFFRNTNNVIVNKISSVITYPFRKVYSFSSDLFSNLGDYFANSKKINDEKAKLEQDKKALEYQLLEMQKILDENESLKNMLAIKQKYQHFNIKLAKIIYREHDNWTQTFKVDIGSNEGIRLNQPVVHENGLVGFVSNVEESSATITTILDPLASVSVNISTINEPAVLKGDLELKSNNRLKLTYIPIDAEISISDMLYTSGLGSTYPSSIPVGKIIEVINKKNDVDRYAIVEPNVNIRTITEVGIIIN